MIRKSIVVLKFCLVLMLIMVVDKGFAEGKVTEYKASPNGDHSITFDGYEINILNGESTTVSIKSEGKVMEEWQLDFAKVSKVFSWKKGDFYYVLFENTYDGTGSYKRYAFYEFRGSEMDQLLLTDDYNAGSVEVNENSIIVSYLNTNVNSVQTADYQLFKDTYIQGTDGSVQIGKQAEEVKAIPAKEEVNNKYSIQSEDPLKGTNPTPSEMNLLLTSEALKAGVPPELVKAIAWQESSWQQYRTTNDPNGLWEIGDPVISFDGGIGLMQITEPNMTAERARRLKTDIVYNIQEGLKILKDKWTYSNWGRIPKINGNDMQIIEDWYFAVMAYNGVSRRNDPQYYPGNTYQDVIYNHVERYAQMETTRFPEQLLKDDIYYTSTGSLQFKKPHYHINGPYQASKHLFNVGDLVKATEDSVRLRNAPEGTEIRKTIAGETLQIVGPYKAGANRENHFVWYPVKDMNSNETYFIASSYLEKMRISGENRYATAVEISRTGWDKSDVVVLARGDDFPDALAGTPLAYQLDAPILLTRSNELVEETKKELLRLNAKKVVILGGNFAVNEKVEEAIGDLGMEVERIAGLNRYETAKLIANKMGTDFSTVVVAHGKGFPDALAIAPYAARNGIPILLTEKTQIPGPTTTMLSKATNTIVVGGKDVISDNLLKSMPEATRIAGANRYETSYKIGSQFNFAAQTGLVVNGMDFPDALTGSVLAAKLNSPLLLVKPDILPAETKMLAEKHAFNQFSVLGGIYAVENDNIINLIK
ncbi:cell wall-binding repeat-containing protein [Sutcliffiella halmapala]